jgi:hypothetical protein
MNRSVWVALRRSGTVGVVLSFVVVIGAMRGAAQTPTLVWDPSPDPEAIGYIVYWGNSSGSYTNALDVGKSRTFTIPNAIGTYYMVVSAYNVHGVVGPRSREVSTALTTLNPIDLNATTWVDDDTPPAVAITMPTTQRNHHTLQPAVLIGGTASDDTGISSILWQNSRGGGGRASGTDAWIASIPVYAGSNAVSITAIDAAGNAASTRITIFRRSE